MAAFVLSHWKFKWGSDKGLALRLLLSARRLRNMDSQGAGRAGRVAEISGWDAEENFFVEKAVLQEDDGGNRADLRARLRVGSLVFVRMIEENSMNRAMPMTYRVSSVGVNVGSEQTENSAREIGMIRLRPRETMPKALLEFTFRDMLPN